MNTGTEQQAIERLQDWLIIELLRAKEITHIHIAAADDCYYFDDNAPAWVKMFAGASPDELEHARIAVLDAFATYIKQTVIPKLQEELPNDYHPPFIS